MSTNQAFSKIVQLLGAAVGLLLLLLGVITLTSGNAQAGADTAVQAATAATFPITGTQWTPPSPAYRVIVENDGIYQLTYTDLNNAGLPVSSLDPRTLRMFWMGQEIAIQVDGEGDGSFDASDRILFDGRSVDSLFYGGALPDNKYTGENVYWLTYGGVNGKRMAAKDGSGTGTTVGSYRHTDHQERNQFYFNDRPYHPGAAMPGRFEPGADRWFWIWHRDTLPTRNYPFVINNLAPGAADGQVVVKLQGTSGKAFAFQPDVPHHIRLSMNSTLFYDNPTAGYDYDDFTITGTVPANLFQEGLNFLNIEFVASGDSTEVYVNWYEVTYGDQLVAESDMLLFDGQSGAGPWQYTVSGFTNSDIRVYDVTDLFDTRVIVNGTVNASDVTFADAAGDRRYAAVSANGFLSPKRIEAATYPASAYTPADLLDTTNGADWIAIAHRDVFTEALRLATYRASQYRVKLIDVQQIYDQFNGGLMSSESIREFLRYAYFNWNGSAPQFVLLFGDGTNDMRNYRFPASTLIPPFLTAADPILGETAADNRYVTLVGNDILPDMSIGRFPVDTQAEAALVVSKTIDYESTPTFNDWNLNVALISDDLDGGGGDFYAFSDTLADGYADPNQTPESKFLPAPYTSTKIYLGQTCDPDNVGNNNPPTECRQDILNTVNNGALFTSYVGHAQTGNWAVEGLVNSNIADQFTNYDKLSIFLGMACFEGFFHQPDITPLAEHYLLNPNGGAVASWSPTGFGVATGHDWLEQGLFLSVFQDDQKVLGKAMDAGKLHLYTNGPQHKYDDLIDTFLLFGDPALQIQGFVNPTAVDMAGMSVQTENGQVVVRWNTGSETEIAGFNVLRGEDENGPFVQVNAEPIVARYAGTAGSASYDFLDASAVADTSYWYKLQVLKLDGSSQEYGLTQLQLPRAHSLYLPGILNH